MFPLNKSQLIITLWENRICMYQGILLPPLEARRRLFASIKNSLPVIILHRVLTGWHFYFFIYFILYSGSEKGGGRVARLAWVHFSLFVRLCCRTLKRISGRLNELWPLTCCKKRPASHGGSSFFFTSSFFFLWLVEQLKHRKCKNVKGGVWGEEGAPLWSIMSCC